VNDQQVHDFLVSAPAGSDALRQAIDRLYHAEEAEVVRALLAEARFDPATQSRVDARARELVRAVRERKADQGLMEAFMQEYDLSSEEGVVLMCLAEALLRIPDDETAEKLIADKLGDADWESHLGKSNSVLVNASTWGLMLTGKLVRCQKAPSPLQTALKRPINRSGEPMVRTAICRWRSWAQYVMGRTIEEALTVR
jgi:RHH-type proline utilization regulon transcriptional repressor/proline dehydrogenase/delta 1-pyrroline-5-carboxylate dehydrogenase